MMGVVTVSVVVSVQMAALIPDLRHAVATGTEEQQGSPQHEEMLALLSTCHT